MRGGGARDGFVLCACRFRPPFVSARLARLFITSANPLPNDRRTNGFYGVPSTPPPPPTTTANAPLPPPPYLAGRAACTRCSLENQRPPEPRTPHAADTYRVLPAAIHLYIINTFAYDDFACATSSLNPYAPQENRIMDTATTCIRVKSCRSDRFPGTGCGFTGTGRVPIIYTRCVQSITSVGYVPPARTVRLSNFFFTIVLEYMPLEYDEISGCRLCL